MNLSFSRQTVLIGAALFLVVAFAGHRLFFYDGGITIREKQVPLSVIMDQLKKKGGIPVHSNIDPNTLVTMDVQSVPLAEAMEVLATELDARWMPYYVLAPDKAGLSQVLGALEAGSGREGVKTFYRPLQGPAEWVIGEHLPDVARLTWVKEALAGKKDMVGVLGGLAEGSDAGYAIPLDWNPAIGELPKKKLLGKAVAQVADSAKARNYAFLYLHQRERNPAFGGGPGQGERPQSGGNGQWERQNQDVVEKRLALRMASLPESERVEAEKNWVQQKNQWQEMEKLSPEERRAKVQVIMEDPAFQERMEERAERRDGRSSPEKRRDRYKSYAERKKQIKGSN